MSVKYKDENGNVTNLAATEIVGSVSEDTLNTIEAYTDDCEISKLDSIDGYWSDPPVTNTQLIANAEALMAKEAKDRADTLNELYTNKLWYSSTNPLGDAEYNRCLNGFTKYFSYGGSNNIQVRFYWPTQECYPNQIVPVYMYVLSPGGSTTSDWSTDWSHTYGWNVLDPTTNPMPIPINEYTETTDYTVTPHAIYCPFQSWSHGMSWANRWDFGCVAIGQQDGKMVMNFMGRYAAGMLECRGSCLYWGKRNDQYIAS